MRLLRLYPPTRYKHYERWATANDFPVENVVNDGSTTLEDRLGAVADLQLAISSRRLEDDIMVVRRMKLSVKGCDVGNIGVFCCYCCILTFRAAVVVRFTHWPLSDPSRTVS